MKPLRCIFHTYFSSLLALAIVASLGGCLGLNRVPEGKYVLTRQKVNDFEPLEEENLEDLYEQQRNRTIWQTPLSYYVGVYRLGELFYDSAKTEQRLQEVQAEYSTKIEKARKKGKQRREAKLIVRKQNKEEKLRTRMEKGNQLMRWGEALVLYDSAKAELSRQRLAEYAQKKGYLRADVSFDRSFTWYNTARLTYTFDLGPAYHIDTVNIITVEPTIDSLLLQHRQASLLKQGRVFDQAQLTKERERIDQLLKNSGYFKFSRQYVAFRVDTTMGEHGVGIRTLINQPADGSSHEQFRLDSVSFTVDSDQATYGQDRLEESYNGIVFRYLKDRYSEKVLDRRIFLYPDSLYSRQLTLETQRQLGNLDIFKFINVNYDTTGGRFVANIFASLLPKYQTSSEFALNVSQGLPGPFVTLGLKNRNLFHQLEVVELNLRGGIEGVAAATDSRDVYNSWEIGANGSVSFPRLMFPLGPNLQNRISFLDPRSRLSAGYTWTDRPEYWRRNLNLKGSYLLQKNNGTSYQLTFTDLSYIQSGIKLQDFQDRLDELQAQGSNLFLTFQPSFISSIGATATYNFGSYGTAHKSSALLRLFAESGGTTLNLWGTDFWANRGLQTFQYWKLEADFRRYIPLSRESTFAYRVNVGYANAYGSGRILPYEKYFFAGGSNGIRAWRPRRLGPGSSRQVDPATGQPSDLFEQPGDILLQASVEVRRKLVGFIQGALFIDAGNVWNNPNRSATTSETEFDAGLFRFEDFWQEIAVGTGVGVRLDFTFVILRFDLGIKVVDPAQPAGEKFVFDDYLQNLPFGRGDQMIFNLGIGHPF